MQGFRVFYPGGDRPPRQAMMGFMDEHREAYRVEPIGKILPMAPSTYDRQAARRADPAPRSARAQRDAVLMGPAGLGGKSSGLWRAQGLAAAVPEGLAVACGTVACQMGLKGVGRGPPVKTTLRDPPVRRLFRRSGQPAIPGRATEGLVGVELDRCLDRARLCLRGLRHRCLGPVLSGLDRLQLDAHAVRPGGPGPSLGGSSPRPPGQS